jgi:hypothetical protein
MDDPPLRTQRALEMYFLDVGQGDAAFIVTPGGRTLLVDGGLRDRALGFLIWKYRLDRPENSVTIDYLILSHADSDHVEGLIPVLEHPQITVNHIVHNGLAVYAGGFDTPLGNIASGALVTRHDGTADLAGQSLARTFGSWIQAVENAGSTYRAIDAGAGTLDIGDPDVRLEILGPVREADGSLLWLGDKPHTINGHSVVFRMVYRDVRVFFSGDLNIPGSRHLLRNVPAALFDAHVLKSPHHGSHEYHQPLFDLIRPMITVVSSGDSPDHGHPRAGFLGGLGLAGRTRTPLMFSTEIAATFVDAGDALAVAAAAIEEPITLDDLDFSTAAANRIARRRFKKVLPGIINIRTDGRVLYAARRVAASYQWESYGPIEPID